MNLDPLFIKQSEEMAEATVKIFKDKFVEVTDFESQVLSYMVFGMISAKAMDENKSVENANIAVEFILGKVFGFNEKLTASVMKNMIAATSPQEGSAYSFLVHQGIELYFEFKEKNTSAMFDRIVTAYSKLKLA